MRTTGLSVRVAGRKLIERLDWWVEAGQCWCVIGRNGAGKSTLLRTLAGLREADEGSVQIDGRRLADWPLLDLAQQRAYLPQGRNDAFGYRAIDTVLAARHPYHDSTYWDGDVDYRIAQSALAALDVGDLALRDVRTLSGGERQRVAIAAVLAQDTPLMLLDEPASALDLAHQVAVMNLLSRLTRRDGKAVVVVSHDLNMAHGVATHALLIMPDGTCKAGPVEEVMHTQLLSACLGYPIEAVRHGSRMIFIPVEEQHDD